MEETEFKGVPIALTSRAMVCAQNRNSTEGTGDRRPMVYRPGSMDAFSLPSRMGQRLIYPSRQEEDK